MNNMQKIIQFLIKTNSVFPLSWLYFLLAEIHNEAILVIRSIILAGVFFLLGLGFVSKKVSFNWKVELVLNKKLKAVCAWIEFANMLLLITCLIITFKFPTINPIIIAAIGLVITLVETLIDCTGIKALKEE